MYTSWLGPTLSFACHLWCTTAWDACNRGGCENSLKYSKKAHGQVTSTTAVPSLRICKCIGNTFFRISSFDDSAVHLNPVMVWRTRSILSLGIYMCMYEWQRTKKFMRRQSDGDALGFQHTLSSGMELCTCHALRLSLTGILRQTCCRNGRDRNCLLSISYWFPPGPLNGT